MSTASDHLDRVVDEALGRDVTWPATLDELVSSERAHIDRAADGQGITPEAALSLLRDRAARAAEGKAIAASIRARR